MCPPPGFRPIQLQNKTLAGLGGGAGGDSTFPHGWRSCHSLVLSGEFSNSRFVLLKRKRQLFILSNRQQLSIDVTSKVFCLQASMFLACRTSRYLCKRALGISQVHSLCPTHLTSESSFLITLGTSHRAPGDWESD